MARRSPAATAETLLPASKGSIGVLRALRQVGTAVLILAGILIAIWLYVTLENFLVTDSRFFLPGPPEPEERSEFFRIEGARNVTEEQVAQVFARDFGRSIYLLPLRERRLKLLGIDWVKEASISRFWPESSGHPDSGANAGGFCPDASAGWSRSAVIGGCRWSSAGSAPRQTVSPPRVNGHHPFRRRCPPA